MAAVELGHGGPMPSLGAAARPARVLAGPSPGALPLHKGHLVPPSCLPSTSGCYHSSQTPALPSPGACSLSLPLPQEHSPSPASSVGWPLHHHHLLQEALGLGWPAQPPSLPTFTLPHLMGPLHLSPPTLASDDVTAVGCQATTPGWRRGGCDFLQAPPSEPASAREILQLPATQTPR